LAQVSAPANLSTRLASHSDAALRMSLGGAAASSPAALPGSASVGALRAEPVLAAAVSGICDGLEEGIEKAFWSGLQGLIEQFGPRNAALLQKRADMQRSIDAWHAAHPEASAAGLGSNREYVEFLRGIGYLQGPAQGKVEASTCNVDPEIGAIAGPQLVCPIDKARFVLNSCNARWGSLFDATYASNILGPAPSGPWAKARALDTIAFVDAFLSKCFPLRGLAAQRQWEAATGLAVRDGQLWVTLPDMPACGLKDPSQLVGYTGRPSAPSRVLLRHNGLHVEVVLDGTTKLGRLHHGGVSDVVVEAAITAILDMEDSVAVVDADDKSVCYQNLASVMRGDLQADLGGGKVRRIAGPRGPYMSPNGRMRFTLPGRTLAMVRNVGLSMYTDMVTVGGKEVPEHFVDAMATALCAKHDLARPHEQRNSQNGSVYVVKPKMHGPEEVAMVVDMFEFVERAVGLPPLTVKLGIMDEERRTTANLMACIGAASQRVCFINTGFMDRVGDEIHTSMAMGPAFPKERIKAQAFFQAYEDHNVLCGLRAGLPGRAQVGKGMWAQPDNMEGLLKAKGAHPRAGASCAWVPSPQAAVVHALHYHEVDVAQAQRDLKHPPHEQLLAAILCPPVMSPSERPSGEEVQQELEESCQSILGYVVRWVEQGVGCSKVPDLRGVQLMEDRATLRISSQLLASWLRHGVVTDQQLDAAMRKMARVVDEQNVGDAAYRPMCTALDQSLAFQAAGQLVRDGCRLPSGLTEPVLHTFRRRAKAARREQRSRL